MDLISKKIIVKGRVQGVGFRQFTVYQAEKFNIQGTVRNLRNGDVECIAIGTKENLAEFIEALKKGPPLSRVENITINDTDLDLQIKGFRIVY